VPNFKEDLLDKSDVKAGCRKETSKVYLLSGISSKDSNTSAGYIFFTFHFDPKSFA